MVPLAHSKQILGETRRIVQVFVEWEIQIVAEWCLEPATDAAPEAFCQVAKTLASQQVRAP